MPYDMPMPVLSDISSTLFANMETEEVASRSDAANAAALLNAQQVPQWSEFFNTPDPELSNGESESTLVSGSNSASSSRPSSPLTRVDGRDGSPVPSLSNSYSAHASPLAAGSASPPRRRSLSQGALPRLSTMISPWFGWSADVFGFVKRQSMEFLQWEEGRRPVPFGWENEGGELFKMESDD